MGDKYSIVQGKINTATMLCVEQKKKQIKYILRSRKHFEPECRMKAEEQYRAELDAAQNETLQRNEVIDSAFNQSLNTGSLAEIIKPLLIIGIIAIIFYLLFL
jgi:hypothetical protein